MEAEGPGPSAGEERAGEGREEERPGRARGRRGGAARGGMQAGWGAGYAQGLVIARAPSGARGPSGRTTPPVLEASFPLPASWGRSGWRRRPCLPLWRPPIACTGGALRGGHGWEGASPGCFGP